jgi:hypothetical protein
MAQEDRLLAKRHWLTFSLVVGILAGIIVGLILAALVVAQFHLDL